MICIIMYINAQIEKWSKFISWLSLEYSSIALEWDSWRNSIKASNNGNCKGQEMQMAYMHYSLIFFSRRRYHIVLLTSPFVWLYSSNGEIGMFC